MTPGTSETETARSGGPADTKLGEASAESKAVAGGSSIPSGDEAVARMPVATGAEQSAPSSPPASSHPSTDFTGILGILPFVVIFYKILAWDNLAPGAWQMGVTGAVLLIVSFIAFIAWRRSKGPDSFRKLQVFGTLWFTILVAAALAVVLDSNNRALGLKLFAIAFLSALPAWLYYQFLARRGKALWDEYVLNLFRLHADRFAALPMPPRHSVFYRLWLQGRTALGDMPTEPEERNVYRRKFEGVFGEIVDQPEKNFFRGENAVPVLMSTMLISVGWVIVIQPESLVAFPLFPPFQWSGTPAVPMAEMRFAFLGAYFFILQMLVRRYYQNDLKTGAYINATLRIIVVVLLTWMLGTVFNTGTAEQRLGAAFLIGVFPEFGWQLLQRMLKLGSRHFDLYHERYPLRDLDGLNPWYQSRLIEEGIEDLQSLVTANIVDVMLYTRIPVERLVDWIDQAVLYLHVAADTEDGTESVRAKLRRHGIRAATDMLDAYDPKSGKFAVPGMENLLNSEGDKGPNVMLAVCTALQREPVLHYVRRWKYFPDQYLAPEVIPAPLARYGRFTPAHGVMMEGEAATT